MEQSKKDVLKRFKRIYLGDSLIKRIEFDIEHRQCLFLLNAALELKDEPNPSIFDPARRFKPASLVFSGVRSIVCPEGEFFLNSTIIDFEVAPDENSELVRFYLRMTGGFDNESFMRSLVVKARDFYLGETDQRGVERHPGVNSRARI
jgi:hypothetical protein